MNMQRHSPTIVGILYCCDAGITGNSANINLQIQPNVVSVLGCMQCLGTVNAAQRFKSSLRVSDVRGACVWGLPFSKREVIGSK